MVVGEINLMLLFLRLQRRPTRATTAGAICRLGEREWIVFRSWSLLRVTRTTRSSARAFSLSLPQYHKHWGSFSSLSVWVQGGSQVIVNQRGNRPSGHRHRRSGHSGLPFYRVSSETAQPPVSRDPTLVESLLAGPMSFLVLPNLCLIGGSLLSHSATASNCAFRPAFR